MVCIKSAYRTESDFTITKGNRYGFNDVFYSMKNKIWMLSYEINFNTPLKTATSFAANVWHFENVQNKLLVRHPDKTDKDKRKPPNTRKRPVNIWI